MKMKKFMITKLKYICLNILDILAILESGASMKNIFNINIDKYNPPDDEDVNLDFPYQTGGIDRFLW